VDTLFIGGETCCTRLHHPSDAPVLSGASYTDSAWFVLAPFWATASISMSVSVEEEKEGEEKGAH